MRLILLVEPSDNTARVIKRYLEADKKLRVVIASSAQEAIHAADDTIPELVVLELAMPRHNGYAFLHEFRSHNDWSNIPVIVHSHLARQEAAMAADWKNLGAREYLYKPTTSLKKLKSAVDKVLGT